MHVNLPRPDLRARFQADLKRLTGSDPGQIGIAVSGGPDSLALLLLCHAGFAGQVEAASVDHGLRPESAAEAGFVAAICRELGVPHALLKPDAPISGNIQSASREARYQLLESWRSRRELVWIATGHHLDDQAETLLMRLNRGSGLSGLACVRPVNGRIVRPLLGWRHKELEGIIAASGLDPVVDPSNEDERYDRARFRRQMLASPWIDPAALSRSALALGEAESAMEWAVDRLWAERVSEGAAGFRFDPTGLPLELLRRLVLRLLRAVDPSASPRGDELTRFIHSLQAGRISTLARVKGMSGTLWTFDTVPPRRPR